MLRLRLRALAACWVTVAGVGIAPAAAQTVLTRVVASETSQPIFGALAHLIDDQGRTLRSVLTDERGRALFVSVPPARYRVRAEMIGMATRETAPFDVAQGATDAGELRLEPRPIDLVGIDVTAERRRCTARPAGEGLLVASLWEEARKALAAAALTEQQGLYRYETMRYERDIDPATRVVVREDQSRREGYMRAPFESLAPEDFAAGGFVRPDGSELVYYAPDADVLLSDSFLDTHCFRVEDAGDRTDVVGLSFEPLGRRRNIVDIAGTLWLSDETAELRWIEYVYSNLDLPVETSAAGGRVQFERMSDGTWIIPDWWIDMPLVGNQILDNGTSRPTLRSLRRTGGRVLAVHEGGGRTLVGRRQQGGIEGIVVDSTGAPMAGARVGVIGGSQQVFTDGGGRFGLLGLSEGLYEVRFVDPRVADAGLVPPPVTREVILGEVSYLEYHMPSLAEMMTEACRAESPPERTGLLAGRVADETGAPWSGATVRVMWGRLEVGFDGATGFVRRSGREATTAPDGTYQLCGLPQREQFTVSTIVDGREVQAEPVTIGGSDAGRIHEIRRPRR
jgi:hypothetical protein